MQRAFRAGVALSLLAVTAAAGEIPEAIVALEVAAPPTPGRAPEAAPLRFALLPDYTVYVGGSSELSSARLDKDDFKDIEKQISRVRKLPGLGSSATFSPGGRHYRLILKKGPTILASGDPAQAPAQFRPLAELLQMLEGFDHPALRPYRPQQFALLVQTATLAGGCRLWTFGAPPGTGSVTRSVTAEAASDWPTGATPASVCSGDKTYVVALRPLVPGERP
jgi:hypothetical protein